jgi:hypothetical protein
MNEFLKETGKYCYDISKIILALAVFTPLVKNEPLNIVFIFVASGFIITGAFMIYKGGTK